MPIAVIIIIAILISISRKAALPESVKEEQYRIAMNRKGTNGRLFGWFLFFLAFLLIAGALVH